MPLPAGFPQAPKRPPAAVALVTAEGGVAKAWLDYFDALERFQAAVRVRLDTI